MLHAYSRFSGKVIRARSSELTSPFLLPSLALSIGSVNQTTTTSPDDQNTSNTTANILECSMVSTLMKTLFASVWRVQSQSTFFVYLRVYLCRFVYHLFHYCDHHGSDYREAHSVSIILCG